LVGSESEPLVSLVLRTLFSTCFGIGICMVILGCATGKALQLKASTMVRYHGSALPTRYKVL